MKLSDYQETAYSMAVYPHKKGFMGLAYAALGLNGEAGETAEQIKKTWRDDGEITPERREKILDELGDTLWYLAAVASELGESLDLVAHRNLEKLSRRRMENKIHGDGSDR